jgi:hypothetical protein
MNRMSRRAALAALGAVPLTRSSRASFLQKPPSFEQYLADMAWSREVIDEFLDPREPNWATFDAELGYRHANTFKKDGIDGSYCIYRMEPTGERRRIHFADKPCRVNTYGDSFTHCDQVSDGETWQEYLAAHFGEPIRNYGTGGYGVYQAYRRMLREEKTAASAPFILFNIWIDDHRRSLMSCRWFHIQFFRELIDNRRDTHYFHANPWCHVRFNLNDGRLLELENSHPTPESLYLMCDPNYVVEHFRDDLYVQIEYAIAGGTPPMLEEMRRLDELMGAGGRWDSPEVVSESADRLFWRSGMKASEQIVDKALQFARDRQKKLLFLVSYRGGDVASACEAKVRLDVSFVEFLSQMEIPFVDSLQKHVEDFRDFGIPADRYVRRYYNGHYAPAGNHFFAFAIKDDLLAWLDPVPVTYRKDRPSVAEVSALLAR